MKPKLLIVDDDEEIRAQMKWALASEHEVLLAEDRGNALAVFREHLPEVVLLDLGLPPDVNTPDQGLATMSEILACRGLTKIVIISGQSERGTALKAIGEGAYDFLAKPVDLAELKVILRRAFHIVRLERDYHDLQNRFEGGSFEGMLGTSAQMQSVFSTVRKVAGTQAGVLVLGESGTGKELTALAIHRRSPRRDAGFVAINCSAIPEQLLESELFGHEKGAFTGAHLQRKGHIESASGGTLFLDEVGELPPTLQVKLLRFLQEQRITRVGGRQEIQVDTRVIAATSVDLPKFLQDGRFREDLYYRLAVVVIRLPSLRERAGDVALLGREFLRRFASQHGRDGMVFDREAMQALERHPWPGNVRELENRVKRAVIMAEGKRVTAEHLELDPGFPTAGRTLREAREHVERKMVEEALRRHSGKVTAAAAELGISRPTLYELMEKLGIQHGPRDFGPLDTSAN